MYCNPVTTQRRRRALELVEQRERESLETTLLKQRRTDERERSGWMPPAVEPEPMHMDVFNKAAKQPIDLTVEFGRAARAGDSAGDASAGIAQDLAPEGELRSSAAARRGSGTRMHNDPRDRRSSQERKTEIVWRLTMKRRAGGTSIATGKRRLPIPRKPKRSSG